MTYKIPERFQNHTVIEREDSFEVHFDDRIEFWTLDFTRKIGESQIYAELTVEGRKVRKTVVKIY